MSGAESCDGAGWEWRPAPTPAPERPAATPADLECVVNVSEGRDAAFLGELAAACGRPLLDLHADPDHHRAVLTLAGGAASVEAGVRRLARCAVSRLSLEDHDGAHPRLGVVDVVPFVPLPAVPAARPLAMARARDARDRYCAWSASELGIPCFRYGVGVPATGEAAGGDPVGAEGGRSLPEVRRGAFAALRPDTGPPRPHPRWGASAVGARGPLVAYNLWLAGATPELARSVAAGVRGRHVRALAFELAAGLQVSCNLVAPFALGPADIYDRVSARLAGTGATVARCELVGLVPAGVLEAVPPARWATLDLDRSKTIEGRLDAHGLS